MESESHSLGIIPIALSKLLERFAYYGMRSIFILYIVKQLEFSRETASSIYGILGFAIGLLPILGGLIGDFLLSTRTTAIIGGFIQALGCFVLAFPSQIAVYAGLCLIAIGTGLYAPNLTSMVCSLYRKRTQKVDSAMLILYTAINLGAGIGALVIGMTSEYLGFKFSFIFCGVIMLFSPLILLFSNNLLRETSKTANIYLVEEKNERSTGLRVVLIIITLLSISVFWALNNLSSLPFYDRTIEVEAFSRSFFQISSMLNPIVVILGGIILAILYSFVKSSSLLKISIGYVIFALSVVLIVLFHKNEMSSSYILFVAFVFFLQGVAELFISPTILSVICQYGPARFNATIIAAYSVVSILFSFATSYAVSHLGKLDTTSSLLICICIAIFLAVTFLVFYILSKQKKTIA